MPLQAQQPFSPGILHQLNFSAGTMYHGNGKTYFTGSYEYELGRRFTIDLKGAVNAGIPDELKLQYTGEHFLTKPFLSKPYIDGNPDNALVKFRVIPTRETLVTVSPRLQFNLRQNTGNRIWIAAGPVGAFVRRISPGGFNRNSQSPKTYAAAISLQRYLTWGLNGELGYNLSINKTLFLSANAGAMFVTSYDKFNNPRLYATIGIGLKLGGYPKTVQE